MIIADASKFSCSLRLTDLVRKVVTGPCLFLDTNQAINKPDDQLAFFIYFRVSRKIYNFSIGNFPKFIVLFNFSSILAYNKITSVI